MTRQQIAKLTQAVAANFRTFGGGAIPRTDNPITSWLADEPVQFALGVLVEDVVKFVVAEARKMERRDALRADAQARREEIAIIWKHQKCAGG